MQRVRSASVTVEASGHHAAINEGLLVLLGVMQGDTEADADWMAGKIARLRIFRDDEGRMNRSVEDIKGSVLMISQFTLAGDCRKGNRPSFVATADPPVGEALYERAIGALRRLDVPVEVGEFGGDMQVELVNDGPVTVMIER